MSSIKLATDGNKVFLTINQDPLTFPLEISSEEIDAILAQPYFQEEIIDDIIAELPDYGKVNLSSSFKQIGKLFSEKLNRPIIYTDKNGLSKEAYKEAKAANSWQLNYYGYVPGKDEYAVESLLTTGNGFIGLRGTTPEMTINEEHYPATYLAGLYNEAVSTVAGQQISNEDFVNAPNLQYLTLVIDGEQIVFSEAQVQELSRNLDLRTGLFQSQAIVKTKTEKEVLITTKKIVSMANRNQYGISYQIVPLNFSGEIEILSEADGTVFNYNVARYRSLNKQHLAVDEQKVQGSEARLVAHTNQSQISIIQESKLRSSVDLIWENQVTEGKILQRTKYLVELGESIDIEKLVFVEVSHNQSSDRSFKTNRIRVAQCETAAMFSLPPISFSSFSASA